MCVRESNSNKELETIILRNGGTCKELGGREEEGKWCKYSYMEFLKAKIIFKLSYVKKRPQITSNGLLQ